MSRLRRVRPSWDGCEKLIRRLVSLAGLLVRLLDELSRIHPW
jgi:hypothetical protein